MLLNAFLSALLNVLVLAGLPFLGYFLYHKWRHKRRLGEISRRAGLRIGDKKYLVYSALFAIVCVALLLAWQPPLESFTGEGSPQHAFVGLGLGGTSIAMALLYGVVKTGFSEELLFRGLIAGSLSRRLSLPWANLWQALIFLLPHLLILHTRPELWGLLPVVFVGALVSGWLRIKSGSIFGPWLIHAALNIATCLNIAVRTGP